MYICHYYINHACNLADKNSFVTMKVFTRRIKVLTFCGFKQLHLLFTTWPPILNTLSDVTLVAHIQRYFWAVMESKGSLMHSSFHHWRGDSSMSRLGYCKYISSSCLNWSDTVAVPAFVPNVEDEAEPMPNIELNLPFFFVGACKLSCESY